MKPDPMKILIRHESCGSEFYVDRPRTWFSPLPIVTCPNCGLTFEAEDLEPENASP